MTQNPTNNSISHKEKTFKILLSSSLFLSGTAFVLTLGNYLFISFIENKFFTGISPLVLLIIFLGLLSLIWISKNNRSLASHFFLYLLWIPATYASLRWGALFYQAIIIYALVIILAGILLSTTSALFITIFTCIYLIITTRVQYLSPTLIDSGWRQKPEDIFNAITVVIVLTLIFLVIWLYNHQLQISLKKIQNSKIALKKEKDSLGRKVKKQTKIIQLEQIKNMMQWQQFIEIGKSTSEILHDIKNPLTSASINLEQLYQHQEILNNKKLIKKIEYTLKNIQYIGNFINSTQQQISNHQSELEFSPNKQIQQAVQLLSPKANSNNVVIKIKKLPLKKYIYGQPSKFSQMLINLISNAIDSYQNNRKNNRQVIISLTERRNVIVINVEDRGCGISKKNKSHIYKPLYTTKNPELGVGLGLTITKNIVEENFSGTIRYKPNSPSGSIFTITIPHAPKN